MSAPFEMDSDEDETFVTIGTPLEIFDEDEIPKKPSSALDLPVKDKKGRERFHGAFTGGFSAGYFNTVGSKDGFTPASFVSSRDKKVEGKSQRPEHFMDEEDFDEHGIAPRKLQTSVTYSSEERRKRRYDEAKAMTSGTLFSGAPAIADLILPQKMTIGIKLLRTLGWKEGQGIGPRATHKQKQKAAEKQAEKARVYGCPLPPSQGSDQELDSDSEVINVTFAPKDTTPIVFSAKTNVHGIGYRGLNPQSALPSTHIKLFEPPPITKSGRKGIRGQAFGVGALEDDDDDIYSVDHLSNYDITMTMEDERGDTLGWTAPGRCYKSNQVPPIGYVGKVLEGFTLSDKPLKPKKLFPPPPLPQGYNVRQRHQFRKKFSKPDVEEQKKQTPESHDAVSRGLTLGEVPIFKSVFDLVSKEDRRKMESAKNKSESPTQTLVPSTTQVAPSALTGSINDENTREDVTQETSGTSMVAVGVRDTPTISAESNCHGYGMLFKPFARDSKKQERYEKYLAYFKQGRKDAYQLVVESHMTEWEREHEEAEFTQASNLYKPMSGMMASRFTRAKYRDDDITSDIQRSQEDKSTKTDQAKAAEMKMYGALTRETFEWHPDPVVCKRFNVANPYPGFSIVGLLGSKRDKMSIFNFLDFSGPAEFVCEEPMAIEAPPVPDKEKTSTEENQTVSFKVQSQNKKMPLGKSIFSNFLEGESNKTTTSTVPQTLDVVEGESVATPSQKTEQSKDQDKSSTVDGEERPPMDLFEAIFGDTDSEEDEEKDQNEDEIKDDSKDLHVELDTGPSTSYTSVTGSSTDQTHQLPGAPVAIETIEERLSPVAMATDDGEYGPALPPPRLHGTNLSSSKCQPVHSDLEESYTSEHHRHKHKEGKHSSKHRDRHKYKESENTENYSKHRDRHKESENAENRSKHRDRHNESENTENRSKHRDRHKEIESTENSSKHREKHKHKKEKKSKKSKHKKSDKKKSRKKKKDRDLDYEASDSSDSDSDGDLPSNRDIINRLKSLSSDGNFSLKNLV